MASTLQRLLRSSWEMIDIFPGSDDELDTLELYETDEDQHMITQREYSHQVLLPEHAPCMPNPPTNHNIWDKACCVCQKRSLSNSNKRRTNSNTKKGHT